MGKKQSRKVRQTKAAEIDAPLPDRIIHAAIDLLKSIPPHQLTYREIAAHAGVSHMAPYRYFKSIEDIFLRIGDDGANLLGKLLREAMEEHPLEPEQQLSAAGLKYFQFATENPIYFTVMTAGIIPQSQQATRQCRQQAFEVLLQIIHNCQLKGVLPRKENSERIAFMLWSFIHGLTVLQLHGHSNLLKSPIQPKESINFVLNAILKGLGETKTSAK